MNSPNTSQIAESVDSTTTSSLVVGATTFSTGTAGVADDGATTTFDAEAETFFDLDEAGFVDDGVSSDAIVLA